MSMEAEWNTKMYRSFSSDEILPERVEILGCWIESANVAVLLH